MTRVPLLSASAASSGERTLDLAYRWILPTGGLGAASVGLGLLMSGWASPGPAASLALFLVGWGTAATLFGAYWWSTTPPAPAPLMSVPAVAPPTTTPGSSSVAGPRRPSGAHLTSSFSRQGYDWRVLSLPPSPADETWISWLPRETRRLGPPASRGSARTAYSAGRPGSLVAIPTRAQGRGVRATSLPGDLARADGTEPTARTPGEARPPIRSPVTVEALFHTPPAPAAPSTGYTEEELDRLFPPAPGEHTPFLTGAPDRVGMRDSDRVGTSPGNILRAAAATDSPRFPREAPPSIEDELDLAMETSDRLPPGPASVPPAVPEDRSSSPPRWMGEFPLPAAPAVDLYLEAANPIPPHLRGTDRLVSTVKHRLPRRTPEPERPKSVCASCSRVVVNLRMSGPCPRCLRPVCSECLRQAFRSHGEGSCVDCSTPSIAVAAN